MKKVVIISSSPRKDGNSETLCKEFQRGAAEAGHSTELVCLRDYDLKYCTGCYSCSKTGRCFQEDGINELAQKLTQADVIVLATPVYFYSMSGQLKVFLDRLVPSYRNFRSDIYLIAAQYDEDAKMMESTFEAIRGATRDCFTDCEEKGVLFGTGLWEKGDAKERADYLEQAYQMGKGI